MNIGSSKTWKKAASREHWRLVVDMAMLKKSMPRRQRENQQGQILNKTQITTYEVNDFYHTIWLGLLVSNWIYINVTYSPKSSMSQNMC